MNKLMFIFKFVYEIKLVAHVFSHTKYKNYNFI